MCQECAMLPDSFRKSVHDVLEHIHDLAYLETHPLAVQLGQPASFLPASRGQKLREVLKDTLEKLRPQQGAPSGAPEWRSYLALRYRYIQNMSMAEIENKLGISLRQLHRELHKGLDALSSLLWEMRTAEPPPAPESALPASHPSNSLQELQSELNQWQLDRQAHLAQSLVQDTISLLNPLLEQRDISLEADIPAGLSPVLVDATLARQALFKALRLIAQTGFSPVRLALVQQEAQVDIRLTCLSCALSAFSEEWQMVELLLTHQGGGFASQRGPAGDETVTLSLPRASQVVVLVIDDNPAIHQLFERYLSLHHYKVIHARSGAEALGMIAERLPDLVILDVMMPGMDGWQVLRDLAQNPSTRAVPVVVCSVLKEPELALSLGARAYLKKPVERVDLLETLARVLHPVGPAAEGYSKARSNN